MPLTLDDLGRLIRERRDGRGVRTAALEADISSATLSRVENGHVPDLATFAKLCKWLKRDPKEFLGLADIGMQPAPAAVVHFKKNKTVKKETAVALGELIIAAQAAIQARDELIGY